MFTIGNDMTAMGHRRQSVHRWRLAAAGRLTVRQFRVGRPLRGTRGRRCGRGRACEADVSALPMRRPTSAYHVPWEAWVGASVARDETRCLW